MTALKAPKYTLGRRIDGARWRVSLAILFGLFAAIAIALHSPGEMSYDSTAALYESYIGHAVGWGPPFFAALISWLGGGLIGSSLLVAFQAAVVYGTFIYLFTGLEWSGLRPWRYFAALALALNPLFFLYVGIIWKDVVLGLGGMSSLVLLFGATRVRGYRRLLGCALALGIVSMLPLLRQQGILLAIPLGAAIVIVAAGAPNLTLGQRIHTGILWTALGISMSWLWSQASERTIAPLPDSPVSVGVMTIRSYDIIGMMAYAQQEDRSTWSKASSEVRDQVRRLYSPERIDTLWYDPAVRGYVDKVNSRGEGWEIWWSGIKHDPYAYLTHRRKAFSSLVGLEGMVGCVPAFWGQTGLPNQLQALGLEEHMDDRAHMFGRATVGLLPTPVFRHWFYMSLLVAVSVVLVRRRFSCPMQRAVLAAGAIGGWLYALSFGPTTIACDFRYLFPVAALTTVLAIMSLAGHQLASDADVTAPG